jgi:hypothetical protein
MADYFSPTVIQPSIPVTDMTPLERLVLTAMFDAEPDGNALYFYSSDGRSNIITLSAGKIRTAVDASASTDSATSTYVAERLPADAADAAEIDIDLSGTSWEFIFQDIVRRSATLAHVTAVTSFMCSRMRADGFGGMAVLITADAVTGKSNGDILADLLDHAEHGSIIPPSEPGVHVLLRLRENEVRDQITRVLEADETLAKITADAVTDADIRAGCLLVAERTDLSEEQGSAVFHAALAAIGEAAGRLAPGH